MIGKTINRYKITAKIGEGGMGSVWKAEDPLLERNIALKFLPESMSSSRDARKRFLREAKAASALNHPGIATVFDAGEVDGRVYIAFLLVDGETISERVERGALDSAGACRIAIDACEALDHAHSHGVLHRDVTSRNIMMDNEGRVVVVDFGLALPEGASRVTRSGVAVGTAAYLAPEVIQGKPGDQRSDLYGLSVVLYEMLTGALPFVSDRSEALYYLAVHEDPKPPSTHCADVPPELDRIVLKALAKDPDKRYQTAREFAKDLHSHLVESGTDMPASAWLSQTAGRSPFAPGRSGFGSLVRSAKGRFAMAVTAMVTMALVVTLWRGGFPPFGSSEVIASVAVLPLRSVGGSSDQSELLADGISESLATKLTRVSGLRVTPWVTSRRYGVSDKTLKEIAEEVGVDALVVGTIRQLDERVQGTVTIVEARTETQVWAEEFQDEVDDLFAVQSRIAIGVASGLKGSISGEEETELARPPSQNVDAYELYLRGSRAMLEDTQQSNSEALAYFEKAVELDPQLVDAHVGIGAIHSNRFFYGWEGGSRSLELAEASYRKAIDLDPESARARGGLAQVFWERGQSEQCLKEVQPLSGRDDIRALFALAEAYGLTGLADKAVPLFKEIIRLDPANIGAHWYLVIAHAWAGQFEEALDAGERYFNKFGEDPEVHFWMGAAYQALDELDVAAVHMERARVLFGDNVNDYLYVFLGRVYRQMEESEKEAAALSTGIAMLEQKLSAYPTNFRIRTSLAALYGLAGKTELYRREIEQVMREQYVGTSAGAYMALGYIYRGEGTRVLEILRGNAARGSNYLHEMQFFPEFQSEAMRKTPGYDDCMRELRELDQRLRDKY